MRRLALLLATACATVDDDEAFLPDLAWVLPYDDGSHALYAASLRPGGGCHAPGSADTGRDALATAQDRLRREVDCGTLTRALAPPFALGGDPDLGLSLDDDGRSRAVLARCDADARAEGSRWHTTAFVGLGRVRALDDRQALVDLDLQAAEGAGTLVGSFVATLCPTVPRMLPRVEDETGWPR